MLLEVLWNLENRSSFCLVSFVFRLWQANIICPPPIAFAEVGRPSFQSALSTVEDPDPTETPSHELVGSFYDVEAFPSARLLLNNKGPDPIEIVPTIFSSNGNQFNPAPVVVEGNFFRFIPLKEWATLGGDGFERGNIKLVHHGADLVIGAQIYLENNARSLSHEEKLAEIGKFDSRRQEAVWFQPSNSATTRVVLTNTSDVGILISAVLSKTGSHRGETNVFALGPHQTRLLNVAKDFSDGWRFANAQTVGLSLENTGPKSSLIARIFIDDLKSGYSNLAQFSNPNNGKSNEYQGAGFHFGNVGRVRIKPVIVVKNVGTEISNVAITIPYVTSDNVNRQVALPVVHLSPGEITQIDTRRLIAASQIDDIKIGAIAITYDGEPGSVIAAAHSATANNDLVLRVPLWDPLQQKSPTGGYPWRIEGTSTTKTYIYNTTDLAEDYIASLRWEGGEYVIGRKTLAANSIDVIDVRRLRDEQVPDFRGNTIPLHISSGQLQWTQRRTDNLPDNDLRANLALIGRTEQIDTVNRISSNYACQNYCESTTTAFATADPFGTEYSSFEFSVGEEIQFYSFEKTVSIYGGPPVISPRSSNNWTSTDTNIATVTSGGLATFHNTGDVDIKTDFWVWSSIMQPECPPGPEIADGSKVPDDAASLPTPRDAVNDQKQASDHLSDHLLPECGTCSSFSRHVFPSADVTSKPPKVRNVTATPTDKVKRVTKVVGNQDLMHFATPKGVGGEVVTLTATLSTSAQEVLNEIDWEGATESPSNPLEATVPRDAAAKKPVKIKYRGTAIKEMRVWVVWVTITSTDLPIQHSSALSGNPPGPASAVRGGYNFTHTIQPIELISDSDRPDFSGSNEVAVPAGTHPFNGQSLIGGADRKWDVSRQIRFKIVNPSQISHLDTSTANQNSFPADSPNYPANDVLGNDDTHTSDPENNDPYSNSGRLTGVDSPIGAICHRAGIDGDSFEYRYQFREFTRLEIEKVWMRVSDFYLWRIHLKWTKVNGGWTSVPTTKALDNAGF